MSIYVCYLTYHINRLIWAQHAEKSPKQFSKMVFSVFSITIWESSVNEKMFFSPPLSSIVVIKCWKNKTERVIVFVSNFSPRFDTKTITYSVSISQYFIANIDHREGQKTIFLLTELSQFVIEKTEKTTFKNWFSYFSACWAQINLFIWYVIYHT